MALTLYGKPGPIPFADSIAADYSTMAKGRGRSFKHPKAFEVAVVPNSDRKVTVGGGTVSGLTPGQLNRVGEDGLLGVLPAAEEIQLDAAITSARWDILAIQVANADLATATATLVILKGTEGNAEGSTAVTLNGTAVNWTNTSNNRIWPIRNLKVTPGQQAVTIGRGYLLFQGRVAQVFDATPPDATALPAGSAFIDSSATTIKLRTTDANGTVVTTDITPSGVRTRTQAMPPSSFTSSMNNISSTMGSLPGQSQSYYTGMYRLGAKKPNGMPISTTGNPAYPCMHQAASGNVYIYVDGTIQKLEIATGALTPILFVPNHTGAPRVWVSENETKLIYCTDNNTSSGSLYLVDIPSKTYSSLAKPGSQSHYFTVGSIGSTFYFIAAANSGNGIEFSSYSLASGSFSYVGTSNALGSNPYMRHVRTLDGYMVVNGDDGLYYGTGGGWYKITLSGGTFQAGNPPFYNPFGTGLLFCDNANCYRLNGVNGSCTNLGATAGEIREDAKGSSASGSVFLPNGWCLALYLSQQTQPDFAPMRPWQVFSPIQKTATAPGAAEPVGHHTWVRNLNKGTAWQQTRVSVDTGETVELWASPFSPHPVGTAFEARTLESGGIPA